MFMFCLRNDEDVTLLKLFKWLTHIYSSIHVYCVASIFETNCDRLAGI